jgi:Bacterial membrane protein YfhO
MLPVFSGLRFDEALLLVDFALAILAGLGTSYLETFEWTRSKTNALLGSLMVLLVATTTYHHGAAVLSQMTARGVDWWRGPRSFRVLLVIGACLIALRLFQLLSRRQWTIVASILIAVDMLSYSYGRIPFNRAETIYPDVPLFRFLSQQQQPFRVIALNMAASANVEYVYGLSTAGGYEYMLKRMSSLAESWLEEPANGYMLSFPTRGIVQSKNRILDLLNIRYLIATRFNESEPLMRSSPDRFRQVWSDGNASVFENLTVLPKGFLVPQTNAEVIPSDEGQLARLKESTFDPAQRVILPAALDAEWIDSGKPASPARQDMKYSEGLNWVRVQVAATTPSILVLSQIHYPGWRVYVDGKPAPLLRPDYALTGTMVAPGQHDIEFRFLPTTFMAGAIVSIVSLILAVFAYLKFTIHGTGHAISPPSRR